MPELITIGVDLIDLDDANPRAQIDKDGLQELAASIGRFGVLQPLIVTTGARGRYTLVAGQRRLLASKLAEIATVPAVVRELNGDAAAVALVENLQREQLTPIEEAHAFQRAIAAGTTTSELATAISRTEQLVKDRLALLELPDSVQKHVDTGTLTLGAAAALRTLAPAGDAIVTKAAELVSAERKNQWEDDVTAGDLQRDPGWVLEQALDELPPKERPFLVDARKAHRIYLENVPWPKTVDAGELKTKANKLPEYVSSPYSRPRADALTLTEADLDAARAYGCLLEVPSDGKVAAWINDPVFLADLLNGKLDKALAAWERKQKKAAGSGSAKAAGKEGDARAAVRDERAKQRRAMLAARERNVTLGIALTKKLHTAKPTADNMRLVAELLLEYAGTDLARAGLRYVDETSQTVSTRKDGSISNVAHLRLVGDLEKLIGDRVAKAKTAEEILGVLLQAIVAARLADTKATPTNDQYCQVRGLTSRYGGASKTIVALADKIAKPFKPTPRVRRAP